MYPRGCADVCIQMLIPTFPTVAALSTMVGVMSRSREDRSLTYGLPVNQNNFFRSVRNFVIDLTRMPASASATGLHWQVSQATSLMNIVVDMSTAAGNNHQGRSFFVALGSEISHLYRNVHGKRQRWLHGR